MNIIMKPRHFGRTSDLIRMSAQTGIPIVTAIPTVVLRQQAEKMGLDIPQPLSWANAPFDSVETVYVDDAEYILQNMLHCKIDTIAVAQDR